MEMLSAPPVISPVRHVPPTPAYSTRATWPGPGRNSTVEPPPQLQEVSHRPHTGTTAGCRAVATRRIDAVAILAEGVAPDGFDRRTTIRLAMVAAAFLVLLVALTATVWHANGPSVLDHTP